MKVAAENRVIGRHGITEERQFQIRGSAKAFKILSDGLYSDKVTAVIRELSCNAKDAHVDDGHGDTPFEIHLPNVLEPWFAVTDNGIGLSNEDVMNMYSTYFDSTKTESNKVTGCLGLGSKSPFAYVDSFTVESRWEGKLTLFSCFYNEDGIPTITIMGESMDTDEHNGLTVKMAVMEGDFREFATKAVATLNRFNPSPIVTGNTDYAVVTVDYMAEGTNWKMLKTENSYGESKVHAIQGNVTYPVSERSLGDLTVAQSAIMELTIDLFFDIGDLDVAANREALGYDEATIKNIKDRLDVISKEIPPLFQGKFDDCKTLWTARLLFQEIIRPLPHGLTNVLSDDDVGLKWHKQSLHGYFHLERDDFKDLSIIQFTRHHRGSRGQSVDWGYKNEMKFRADIDILFFYDDIGHGSHSRVTHFIEEHEQAVRYQYLFKTDNRKLLKKISKALGDVTIQPVSNLAKRPKAVRMARRVTSKVLEYTGKSYDRRDSWNPTELDLKTGGIYVMINRFKVYQAFVGSDDISREQEMSNFDDIVSLAQNNGIIDLTNQTIYGIRKGDVAKLKDDSGWINLFDLIRDKLAVVVKKERVSQIMADRQEYHNFNCDVQQFITQLDISLFTKGTPMYIFLHAYNYMKGRDSTRAEDIAKVAETVDFVITDSKPKHNLKTLWQTVYDRYPMLTLMSDRDLRGGYYRSGTDNIEDNYQRLADYMVLVEQSIGTPVQPAVKKAA